MFAEPVVIAESALKLVVESELNSVAVSDSAKGNSSIQENGKYILIYL